MIHSRLTSFFLLLLLVVALNHSSADYPQPRNNYVNDYAGVLSAADANAIYARLHKLERSTKIEVTVVTIGSVADYGTGDSTIESFATNLFNRWQIGNMPRNDGVLILVAIKDRRCRVEMGEWYENRYDTGMKRIVDDVMVPCFKRSAYSTGILTGTTAVVKQISGPLAWIRAHALQIVLVMLIAACIAAGISCMRSGNTGWGWAFFAAALAFLIWLISTIFRRGDGDCSDGFGGGDSGGGGASGSW